MLSPEEDKMLEEWQLRMMNEMYDFRAGIIIKTITLSISLQALSTAIIVLVLRLR